MSSRRETGLPGRTGAIPSCSSRSRALAGLADGQRTPVVARIARPRYRLGASSRAQHYHKDQARPRPTHSQGAQDMPFAIVRKSLPAGARWAGIRGGNERTVSMATARSLIGSPSPGYYSSSARSIRTTGCRRAAHRSLDHLTILS